MYRSAAFTELLRPVAPEDSARATARFRDRYRLTRVNPVNLANLCGLLLLACLLAACAQPGGKTVVKNGDAKPAGTDVVADAAGRQDADARATSRVLWQDAEGLMGLESNAVRAALGAPARIRDEDTARIYQYVGSDCVLDLFLYETAGIYRVTYAEARTVRAEHKAVDSCLRSLPAPIVADNGQPST